MTHVTRCDIVCYIYSGIFLFFTVFIIDLSFYHITWHFETSAGPQYHDTMLHPTIYLSLGKSRQLQGDVALCALGRLSSFEHSCDATFSGFVLRSVSSQKGGDAWAVLQGLPGPEGSQFRPGEIWRHSQPTLTSYLPQATAPAVLTDGMCQPLRTAPRAGHPSAAKLLAMGQTPVLSLSLFPTPFFFRT